eukprot:CAMPEP_0113591078 /NCGR_PEP_ID=MMETSP0015_2-20120614/37048_1 /TAXON_ID=2838 /ORGANISM="Odontella" /LENGTH=253 /DNA_ID=CAMNT_0000497377 /DNA_START=138 /DNA_END=897 /DNA_ORIENTATION=- /assembly_acc=CAM_ASM_000160
MDAHNRSANSSSIPTFRAKLDAEGKSIEKELNKNDVQANSSFRFDSAKNTKETKSTSPIQLEENVRSNELNLTSVSSLLNIGAELHCSLSRWEQNTTAKTDSATKPLLLMAASQHPLEATKAVSTQVPLLRRRRSTMGIVLPSSSGCCDDETGYTLYGGHLCNVFDDEDGDLVLERARARARSRMARQRLRRVAALESAIEPLEKLFSSAATMHHNKKTSHMGKNDERELLPAPRNRSTNGGSITNPINEKMW